ncbi:MAG: FHA domain-containing protein [Coriobacteriia bacterium]|nr:FHA domain-containing protein [Coriobacteriia bacterium]
MVDIVLLFGKILFLALLYLFLLAAVRAGMGMVRTGGTRKQPKGLGLTVARGPKEILGVTLPLSGPIVVGRSPDADLVIADDFVSSLHLKITPSADGAIVEDLGSTNGTLVNGQPATRPLGVSVGDLIEIGTNQLKVVVS